MCQNLAGKHLDSHIEEDDNRKTKNNENKKKDLSAIPLVG